MAAGTIQGALFTVMVVRAVPLSDPAFEHELARQIERSPRFFRNAPVVLDLKNTEGFATADEFTEVREQLRRHALTLVGVQNAEPVQVEAASAAGLASFAPNATLPSGRRAAATAAATTQAEPAVEAAPPPRPAAVKAMLLTEPVRSGTQIYARGTDLVVIAPVSAGAELIADGNIHVYGVLRGRALAGASGDQTSRIFCSRLEAELISIAGRYLVSEQLPAEQRGFPVQITLLDDQLTIARI